jgi:hypothetical protein
MVIPCLSNAWLLSPRLPHPGSPSRMGFVFLGATLEHPVDFFVML